MQLPCGVGLYQPWGQDIHAVVVTSVVGDIILPGAQTDSIPPPTFAWASRSL